MEELADSGRGFFFSEDDRLVDTIAIHRHSVRFISDLCLGDKVFRHGGGALLGGTGYRIVTSTRATLDKFPCLIGNAGPVPSSI